MKANGENFRYLLTDGTVSGVVSEALDFTTEAAATSVGTTLAQVLGEQKAFADYLQANFATEADAYDEADTPIGEDERIQNLTARTDTVLDGETIVGNSMAETIEGGVGDDVLNGAAGNDLVIGGDGDDSLLGGNGADTLEGDDGADTLDGGNTNDLLMGGDGNDLLLGGNGADTLDGGEGADTMIGGLNSDDYFVDDVGDVIVEAASGGFDRIFTTLASTAMALNTEILVLLDGAISGIGTERFNLMTGNTADNTLAGMGGADTLDGADGNDLLRGGNGADSVVGGNGADTLDGGAAGDTLEGGAGNDLFAYYSQGDSSPTDPARRDTILDFVRGEDLIGLFFDADRTMPGQQDFAVIAGAFGIGTPGQVRVEGSAGGVLVHANTDDDADAEFTLFVAGVATLDATDFVF
jgi:Ca2+-binding RTX toxin-like protein